MHWVRWVLTVAWLVIIASLFYDPWTPTLTQSGHPWSPLRLPTSCIAVQDKCLPLQPYPLGTTLFWGAVVPAAILILLVFGHELWRRICPLSFLSQIPRALGWQRQFKRENPQTGKVRYELAKVKPDSWLGKHYPYVQFGGLFIGLCGRILFFNADRIVLACWLLGTIAAAITVGYLYGGKSWCNYFCPMAPVQKVYSEPGGLFGNPAHTSEQPVTQSMCRTIAADGKEQSACVACQNPCMDIDSERSYWDGLQKSSAPWLHYGYVGLVVGYFVYYYLYAGNWNYYFSGAWAFQTNQLATLIDPGFYLFGNTINIPKIVAVPLTLGLFTLLGYSLGRWIEQRYHTYRWAHAPKLTPDIVRHRIFTIGTFIIFNFFFIFGGRPLLQLMPLWGEYIFDLGLVLLSTLWVHQTWQRSPELYARENLVGRFRKQLDKLNLNLSLYLEGRSLTDLNTHEVYILARVLPGFTREKRHEAYKGVVREALQEGYVNYSSSLAVLQQLRQELGVTEDEHRQVLDELGIEDPDLLNPNRQRSLENQIRLTGYQRSLERLISLQRKQIAEADEPRGSEFSTLLSQDSSHIRALRRQYSITPQEEAWILEGLSPEASQVRRAEFLLAQLPPLIACYRALHQPRLNPHLPVLMLLQDSIHYKKESILRSLLDSLATLGKQPDALRIAEALGLLSLSVLADLLEDDHWQQRLSPEILTALTPITGLVNACPLDYAAREILDYLEPLVSDPNPLIQSACLYIIAQLDLDRSQALARQDLSLNTAQQSPLLQATAQQLLSPQTSPVTLSQFSLLEKVVHLFNSDFFHRIHSGTLVALAERAEVRTYAPGDLITEAGDTCRELLILIAGAAKIQFYNAAGKLTTTSSLRPGQTLDELEVLAHSESQNTIIAESSDTRILAIPIDAFDDFLDHDHDFARRVLALESRQLQRLMAQS
jgi:CRP-like cAMP-binding protein